MIFNIDYRVAEGTEATIVGIRGFEDELKANGAPLAEGAVRLQAREIGDLRAAAEPLLLAIYNFKAKTSLTELPADADVALWDMLQPRPKKPKKPKNTDTGTNTGTESNKPENQPEEGLPNDENSNTSTVQENSSPRKGRKMATAKKKAAAKKKVVAKKKAAVKKVGKPRDPKAMAARTAELKEKGMPREGSKAGKLLALILRKGGATLTEMQKATGWKEMRGTAGDLARRAGKSLKMIKEEGKQPRWAAV